MPPSSRPSPVPDRDQRRAQVRVMAAATSIRVASSSTWATSARLGRQQVGGGVALQALPQQVGGVFLQDVGQGWVFEEVAG